MRLTLIILCMMFTLCAVEAAQKPSAKKINLSESELRTLAKASPGVKNAGMLYSVAMATSNNVDRKQEYLKVAAACLIACDKRDVYMKHIKGKLSNAAEFEDELKDDCKKCSGSGTKARQCYVCNGKGRCSVCKGSGQKVLIGFDGYNEWKTCRKCNGSGRCDKCGGEGCIEEKCLKCAGIGKVFSKVVAARVFSDSCNAIADSMNVASMSDNVEINPKDSSAESRNVVKEQSSRRRRRNPEERNAERQNETPSTSPEGADTKTHTEKSDELDYNYFEDGCNRYDSAGNNGFIYVENSSGRVNYLFEGHVNLRPQVQFSDGRRGSVIDAYYVSDAVLFNFPTPEARRLWTSAMRSGCQKMLEWINTAKENKVEHVGKELPESAFKDGYAYASVDLIPFVARQQEFFNKAVRKNIDEVEFAKTARRIKFECVIDSRDNTLFSVKLLFGCSGDFLFELFSCYRKTVDEIKSSIQELMQKADPDSFAKAWMSQTVRNSIFKDCTEDDDVCNRLAVSEKDEADTKKREAYKLYNDFCLSSWYCSGFNEGSRTCLAIKDTDGDWNYILFLGENGVAQRRTFEFGRYFDHDFIFDRHLIVFPTKESRNLWYDIVKRGCGRMLEWVELASEKHVPVVVKKIYDADKDISNKLKAYYTLITKGQGQDELLKKELRTHIDRLEYERNGLPVSLICNVRNVKKKKGDTDCKTFRVSIDLKCGDKYQGTIFKESGTYEYIQKECVKFLCKIDPNALIGAWKKKYGRGDLFK